MIKFVPLILFAALAGFLFRGLSLDPSKVPSPFIGKSAPHMRGDMLNAATEFDSTSLTGQVWILNVWASWCRECVYEHPVFVEMAKMPSSVPLIGLNYKDQQADAVQWLNQYGNPYSAIVSDVQGGIGIDWGVYAVPETFIIDKQGKVQHKVIGPVSAQMMTTEIIPLIDKLNAQASPSS